MSVTVDMNGITAVRTSVPSTYVLSLHSEGSSATFYKIGKTRNLAGRFATLLSTFNSGSPRSNQGFPESLVGICALDGGAFGGCEFGEDCSDKQYRLTLLAHIEGDVELELHRRFAHLRLGTSDLHNNARSSEWFFPADKDEDNFSSSIDAWLESELAASA